MAALSSPFASRRRIGHNDLQARNVAVPGGIALGVLRGDAGCSTARTAEDDRRAHLAAGHIERLGGRVDDLVDRLHGEVERHELDDRAQTRHRRADADAGKAMFRDRRVDHAARTEFLQQALRDLVGALVFGDLFAHDEDVLIGAHLFGHRVAKRFADGHRRHFGSGRNCRVGRNVRLGLRRDGRRGSSRRFSRGRLRRFRFRGFGFHGIDVACGFAILQQDGDRRVHLHTLGAGCDQQLADRAFVYRFHFHRGLVGFDFRDDIAGGHLVPLVLQPLGERAFLHGRGKGRHKDFYRHVCPSPDQSRISV